MDKRRAPIKVDVPTEEALEVIDELNDVRGKQECERQKEESEKEDSKGPSNSKREDLNPKGSGILSGRAQSTKMATSDKENKWELHPADIDWLAPDAEPPTIKPDGKTRLVYKCHYCEGMSVSYTDLSLHMELFHKRNVTQKNYHFGYIHEKKKLEENRNEAENEMEVDADEADEQDVEMECNRKRDRMRLKRKRALQRKRDAKVAKAPEPSGGALDP